MRVKHFSIFVLLMCLCFVITGCSNTNHYEKCKDKSISFLDKNEEKLTEVAEDLMQKEDGASYRFKDKYYCGYSKGDNVSYVKIDIDAQGMLGGQYWGIIYCPNNNFIDGNSTIEIYDEKQTNEDGNNIFVKEKIKENWYFYYDDYDGKIDISTIN